MKRVTLNSITRVLLSFLSITILLPSSVMAITGADPAISSSTWTQVSSGTPISEVTGYNTTTAVSVQEQKIDSSSTENQTIVCTLGCSWNETCILQGTRVQTNTSSSYCDIDSDLKEQKNVDESCLNNYECKTNFCSNNNCYDVEQQVNETNQLLEWIMNLLRSIFGNV